MELVHAEQLIAHEFNTYLSHTRWKWAISAKLTKSLGLCSFFCKKLKFNRRMILANDKAVVLNTVRHEIAHALVGFDAGHGIQWKEMALALGARPDAYARSYVSYHTHEAICTNCGECLRVYFHRPSNGMSRHKHTKCIGTNNGGRIQIFKVEWK